MYLMATFPNYYKSGQGGHCHDGGDMECSNSGSGNHGNNTGACSASVDFGLLEIDENDNSFPWGLIHHNELALMLNSGLGKTMVIDSRSFLEYNTSTIQQSVNVCCSKLVKRRLQQDKVHVLDLLNQTCNIGADTSWDVIVYDQCTEDPSQLTSDNFVAVLLHKLSTTFNSVAFLKGGFLAFQASHPSLTENKSSSHRCSTLTSLSQPCMPVSNIGPTRILPFLYLGSQQDSLNQELAQVNGITYILNVSKTCPRPPFILEGHFHRIPVNDNYCEKLFPFFQEAFQFLDKVREANGCVLIHCLGGVSRSATLAIAYIMRYYRMSSDEAYRYVKDKRPTISPNFNFLGQLLEYEKILRQEELDEICRRKTMRDEEDPRGELDRANPGVMDLHTSSPSSPGPRMAAKPFVMDFSSSPLQHSLVTSSLTSFSKKFLTSAQLMPELSTNVAGQENNSHVFKSANTMTSLHFSEPSYDKCPFPGPPSLSSELHSISEPTNQSQSGLKSYCATYPEPLNEVHLSQGSCLNENTKQGITTACDISQNKQSVSIQSPVCPITGFPSPASAMGSFPHSTCPTTGFPSPASAMSNFPHSTCPSTGFPSPANAMGNFPHSTCPITGFPSPASTMDNFPQSTCSKTGFPGPGFIGNTVATRQRKVMTPTNSGLSTMTMTGQTEKNTVFKNNSTYQNLTKSSNSTGALIPEPTTSLHPNGSEPQQDLQSKNSSQKEQTRSRSGFSLSSVLSSFRWKSRPPTLSLGSPVGSVKDVSRHSKKHVVESSVVGDGRVQLTPVSEAVENCDLITTDVSCGEVNKIVAVATSSQSSNLSENMEESEHDFVVNVRSSGSSLSNATTIAMASTQTYLFSSSLSSASTTSHTVAATSTSSSCLVKPTRLSISARTFTLPLSSPTSDFSSLLAPSHSLPSPGDSNKRKSFHSFCSDSPDKLAKTETSHVHALSPPKTLNFGQVFPGKVRLRLSSKRPFVLPISSPTAATMEDMARLKVTSPTDPPSEAAVQYGQLASGNRQRNSYSTCLGLEIRRKIPLDGKTSELMPRMLFNPSDTHCGSSPKQGVLYGHTKWKSATSLSTLASEETIDSTLSENMMLSEATCPQQQHTDTSLHTSFVEPASVSAMSLSSLSSLSKSCTAIHTATLSSSSKRNKSMTCSVSLQGFNQFPTTSLDKLCFTPCYTKDIVQELKKQEEEQFVSLDHGMSPSDGNLVPSVLDSPMSISSGSSAPSIASSTISPVESTMANIFSENTYHTSRTDHSSSAFEFYQPQVNQSSNNTVTPSSGSPQVHLSSNNTVTPSSSSPQVYQHSVLSPTSTSDFILSPSSMPQATAAPSTPTCNSSHYSSSLSMEPLSPMSLSDSASSSPVQSPIHTSITSSLPSCISTPGSSLSSPNISSPPFSPLISSPLSSSSHVSVTMASIASSSKVVLRRDKNKRVIDRPNSIAFSSYPACDLVPVSTAGNSQQGLSQSSLDDSSEAYMSGKSKRSRYNNHQGGHVPHGRTSWGGYSEREMYRQITAAMENAMLRTQVFSSSTAGGRRLASDQASSRKARSLDDIVDSNIDEDNFMSGQSGNTSWGMCAETCTFEQYRCGMQNVAEPYHSNSSLSSNGSHSGSMEIQVS